MPASSGATSALQVKVYANSSFNTAAPTWANLTAATNGLILAANLLDDVTDVGAITAEGTSIEYIPFGQNTSKRLSGVASLQTISFTFVFDESDASQVALANANTGANYALAFVKDTGATQKTAYYLLGSISGTEHSLGSNSEASSVVVNFELSQAPLRVVQV